MTPDADRLPEAVDIDHVLDAAVDAFVNDGFESVTLRRLAGTLDIAEVDLIAAFDSVEHLLVAMLDREYTGMFHAILDDIERDPLGGRLSRICRYVLSAVYERPLARALYLMDSDGLSRIVRFTHGFAYIPQLTVRPDFIDRMKRAGTVRANVDSAAVSAVISAVSAGAALLSPSLPLADVVDGLARLLEAGVDTDDPDTSRGKAAFAAYANALVAGG